MRTAKPSFQSVACLLILLEGHLQSESVSLLMRSSGTIFLLCPVLWRPGVDISAWSWILKSISFFLQVVWLCVHALSGRNPSTPSSQQQHLSKISSFCKRANRVTLGLQVSQKRRFRRWPRAEETGGWQNYPTYQNPTHKHISTRVCFYSWKSR